MALIDPAMAREMGFDADDVATNQQGLLTADQQTVLSNAVRVGRRRRRWMLVVFSVLIVAAVAAALLGADTDVTPAMVAVVVGLALVPVMIVVMAARHVARSLDAYEHPLVCTVEGRSTWTPSMAESVYLFVGDQQFTVFADQAQLFDPSRTYRVYFVHIGSATPAILSVEIVG